LSAATFYYGTIEQFMAPSNVTKTKALVNKSRIMVPASAVIIVTVLAVPIVMAATI